MESKNLIFAILFGVLMFQDIFTPEKMQVSAEMMNGNETQTETEPEDYQDMLDKNITGISKILDMLQFSIILKINSNMFLTIKQILVP